MRTILRGLISLRIGLLHGVGWIALLGAAGCLGGQTGGEVSGGEEPGVGPVGGQPPAAPGCTVGRPVPSDDASAGFTSDAAVALVNRTPGLVLAWSSGGLTDLSLRVGETAATVCVGSSGEETTLEARVVVVLRSGDGRIESHVPGVLRASARAGTIARVNLDASLTCTHGAPSSWAVACGVSAMAIAGYEGIRVDVTASVTPAGEAVLASGTLEVLGARGGECSKLQGSCSSPTWESIETGSFASE